jgi:CRP/FNR family cyclic AMP-dependent transcriptional regulator
MGATKRRGAKPPADPDVVDLLGKIRKGKRIVRLRKNEMLFAQGDLADAMYFIQTGKIQMTVESAEGKQAVLEIVKPRGFIGEGCLVGQTRRINTAVALQPSTLFQIERRAMLRSLQTVTELSGRFIASLLARNIDLEAHLRAQLFNHSEKRLARILLKIARFGLTEAKPAARIPPMDHEIIARMVGITTSRVTHLMKRFKALGLIDYNSEQITVRAELLTDIVLHD